MWTHPGKKLLFMGGEFGQRREWQHDESLEWHVLQYPLHAGVRRWVRDLNQLYRSTPALHQLDFSDAGFRWVDCDDADVSVISFLRQGTGGELAPERAHAHVGDVERRRAHVWPPVIYARRMPIAVRDID